MSERETWVQRLTSRKFLLCVVGAIGLASQKQYTEAMGLVIAYVAAEGWVDARSVNAATEVEKKAHALATRLLEELAAQTDDAAARPARPVSRSKAGRSGVR